jgi:serine/threonine-protein kinase RsbW
MPTQHVSCTITSELANLPRLRTVLREACQNRLPSPFSVETMYSLQLAVSESASNIIRHAYDEVGGRPIRMEVTVADEQVDVWLFHDGEPFDPDSVEIVPVEEPRDGSMGVFLIQQSVDVVEYSRPGLPEQWVHLTKYLSAQPRGDTQRGARA